MKYLIKKIGYAKRPEGFILSEMAKHDCVFWERKSKAYFGRPIPKELEIGDILIQEVSSSKTSQNHAIIGIFKCTSRMMGVAVGPHSCDDEKNKWTSYVEVENLLPEFSIEAKNRIEQNKPMLLNLDTVWKHLGEIRLPYYAAGWAYIPQDKAVLIIKDIEKFKLI